MNKIRRAKDLGKIGANKYLLHSCIDCGKERWVMRRRGKPKNLRCKSCATKGQGNPNWQGRGSHDGRGYIRIFLRPNDFFYPMATKQGYVTGHRLIMARHLGRCLHPWELVHHKNGIKDDNRMANLKMTSYEMHHAITELEKVIEKLMEENQCLKKKLEKV